MFPFQGKGKIREGERDPRGSEAPRPPFALVAPFPAPGKFDIISEARPRRPPAGATVKHPGQPAMSACWLGFTLHPDNRGLKKHDRNPSLEPWVRRSRVGPSFAQCRRSLAAAGVSTTARQQLGFGPGAARIARSVARSVTHSLGRAAVNRRVRCTGEQ